MDIYCVPCEKIMPCSKTGAVVMIGVHVGRFSVDKYACPDCGNEVAPVQSREWFPHPEADVETDHHFE